MTKWLVLFDSGSEKVVDAEDFWELYNKIDDANVEVVMRLHSNIDADNCQS